MKAQCVRCKEIVPLDFTVGEGGIQVRCSACAGTYFVAATAAGGVTAGGGAPASARGPASAAAPLAVEGMACPKCGETQPRAEACRRCGLLVARWPGVVDASAALEADLEDAREAAALFAACEERWDDPARHDAFVEHCRRGGALRFAAARYRAAGGRRGREDPVCVARLAQLRTLAEFSLVRPPRPSEIPAPEGGYRAPVLFLVVAAVAVVALLVYLAVAPRRRPPTTGPGAPAPAAAWPSDPGGVPGAGPAGSRGHRQ